jgi:cell division protein FtsQ
MNSAAATPFDLKLMHLATQALWWVLAAICVVASVRVLAHLPLFDIRKIQVQGDTLHNNSATLRANVSPRISDNFFSVDLLRVRQAFESVPWVRQAVVRRVFPNQLQVHLQEHRAVALWGEEGAQRLVNHLGEVFDANVGEVEQDSLPILRGPQNQSASILALYQTLQPLFTAMQIPIAQLELTPLGNWRVYLETDATIELGYGDTAVLVARVQRFGQTLTQISARYARTPQAIDSADLRYENGYAIRLNGVSTHTGRLVEKN